MNSVHDMGGQHGHGPIRLEIDEPLFHAPWERKALGLTLAMGATGQWNIDMSRGARESIGAARYLQSSYYEIWLAGLERLMLERSMVTVEEIASGHAHVAPIHVERVLKAEAVSAALARGSPTRREARSPALFSTGQRVRARNLQPSGHTRLPGYVRGHVGTVTSAHGAHVFADRHAIWRQGQPVDEAPCWLYTVVFSSKELWGEHGEADTEVSVEAWEPYLEAV